MSFDSDLDAQAPTGTARFTLDTIKLGGCPSFPVLIVKSATEANAAYRNAMFKSADDPRLRGFGRKASPERADANREIAAEVYAKTVIVGWENVWEDGQPVAFSPAKCLELLKSFIRRRPDGSAPHAVIFRGLQMFVEDDGNFGDATSADPTGLGKG
jgi:hypothetical protein